MEPMLRVQNLVHSGVSQVPSEYIQPVDSRPIKSSSRSIPLIDLSNPDDTKTTIKLACREWGAFHVTNHGVPSQLLRDIRRAGRSFFEDLPISDKLQYACDNCTAASEGYGSKMLVDNEDTVLDWRDYFDHHTLPLLRRNPNNWPEFYRKIVCDYSDEMKSLADRLLGLISESLGLNRNYIKEYVGEFYQNITISYYPRCPQPELTLGLQSHSDMGVITLLIEDDVGGLQVFKDDEWVTVQPLDDAIVVILADQTHIITNGEYISAQHRAITNASRARLSIATFHDPAKTMKISPAPELVSECSPPCYSQVVYGDYVSSWYTKGPDGKQNLDALFLNS